MNSILRFGAMLVISLKRMVANRTLSLATLVGLSVASTLVMSIPIYSDGIYQRILRTEIQGERGTGRPPFAFMFRNVGSWSGPIPIHLLQPLDQYLSVQVARDLNLEPTLFVRYLKSDTMGLFPATKQVYSAQDVPLEWVSFGTLNNFESHVVILEGRFPAPSDGNLQSEVEVLVSEDLATTTGIQVGEVFITSAARKAAQTTVSPSILVKVAGIWRPTDPTEKYWLFRLDVFRSVLIVPESSFITTVVPAQGDSVDMALWYYVMNDTEIHSDQVPLLLRRIAQARSRAVNLLPTVRLDISPENILMAFQHSADSLTLFLFAFSIPIFGMTLVFIGLVLGMVVSQRRNEIAVLHSRGVTAIQLVGLAALEAILLGTVGLAVGIPAAQGIAVYFSRVTGFLTFSDTNLIWMDFTPTAMKFGAIAAGVALVFMVIPTISASQRTLVTYKQEQARQMRRPWWQRIYLDVILLFTAWFGTYEMELTSAGLPMDPFENPPLFLVPTLGIFAVTLIILRFLPMLMQFVAWLASKTNSVGVLLAARYLARSAGGHNPPLILLIMTLSLAIFTATLAQTLNRHTHDEVYYDTGADMFVVEMGESNEPSLAMASATTPSSVVATEAKLNVTSPAWRFLPVSEHLKIAGVEAASRVERTNVILNTSSGEVTTEFFGVDRVDFSRAAFWRHDFASDSLGVLMNNLARTTDGVLVSRDLLHRGYQLGDNLRVTARGSHNSMDINFRIVGVFDYFPTWYPNKSPLIVGNLDYYFEAIGGENPYDVWLRLTTGVDPKTVTQEIRQMYGFVMETKIAAIELQGALSKPERQGFFGLLSVGFLALAVLSVLGFTIYTFYSFRWRFMELGMLRAIGLNTNQLVLFLGSELAFLFMVGLAAGTGMGVAVSNFFIPKLQVGTQMASSTPPFLVQIDWSVVTPIYLLLGLLYISAMVILTFLLLRIKIFQAIKLGETL